MSKSKIAIIGAGNIALKHLEVLKKLKNISDQCDTYHPYQKYIYLRYFVP